MSAVLDDRRYWLVCSACMRDLFPPVRVDYFEGELAGFFSVKQRPRRCVCGAKVRIGHASNGDGYEDGVDTFTVRERTR